jgi:hypothetical protein
MKKSEKTVSLRDLGDIDRGFESFVLAEEKPLLAAAVGPVGNQLRGGMGDADVATCRHRVTRRWMSLTSLVSSMWACVHSVSN